MSIQKQKPTLALSVLEQPPKGSSFNLAVSLSGFPQGKRIKLSFVEVNSDDNNGKTDRVLGTVAGKVAPADGGKAFGYSIIPDKAPPAPPADAKVKIAFSFAKPSALEPGATPPEIQPIIFPLSDDKYDVDEGDYWEIQVREENEKIASHTVPLARIRRQLEGEPRTYDWHDGHDIQLYHDGSTDDRGHAPSQPPPDQAGRRLRPRRIAQGQEGARLRRRQRPFDRLGDRQGALRPGRRGRIFLDVVAHQAAGSAPGRLDRLTFRRGLRRPRRR